MLSPSMLDGALDRLVTFAAERTGFRPDAIQRDRLRRLLADEEARGHGLARVLARVADGEPAIVGAIEDAVSVGETYFFRHPEQFEWIASDVIPAWRARRRAGPFRAWSAGCATGEEAFSLAATLLASMPGEPVEVLGTDLSERAIAKARRGWPGASSLRSSGPLLHPVLEDAPVPAVAAGVRAVTEFAVDNLLAPEGPAGFDLVLCRNVLVYLDPEAARRVLARLTAALAPEGTLILGPLDVDGAVPGLARVSSELPAFARPRAAAGPTVDVVDASPRPARAADPDPPPATLVARAPIPLHVEALALIDRGDRASASIRLGELVDAFPDYLPGLLEQALFLLRGGAHGAGVALLRDVARRAAALPPDVLLEGPEPLPAEFYLCAARRALGSRGARP